MPFPNNLPQQLTSFIGRRREMAEVRRLLSSTRLLTLTGAGGCGKTRLALQAASKLTKEYRDGVWFVDLASLADPALVPQAVASTLGVKEQQGRTIADTLVDWLQPKKMLLILDNCEHLVAACASLANALLTSSANLTVLATSRQTLGVHGETVWSVPSLTLPEPEQQLPVKSLSQYEAIRLFTERALLRRPTFALTPENAPVVTHLCRQLDGIPLAIELAAARMSVLTVGELLEKLDQRFRLLTSSSEGVASRHQTLQAAMAWSYDLLSEGEQSLLRSLSVFAGGCTLEAAQAVWGGGEGREADEFETLDLLSQLAEKSLVIMEEREGKSRYRLLETVRQYAWEKVRILGELLGLRNRHLHWCMVLAEEAEPHLTSEEQIGWIDQLENEHNNLRAALRWTRENSDNEDNGVAKIEIGLRIADALWRFWDIRGYLSEGREHLVGLLALPTPTSPTAFRMQPLQTSVQSQSWHLFRAKALNGAGNLAGSQGDYAAARSLHEESLAIHRELGDKRGIATSLGNLGVMVWHQRDYAAARSLHEESLAIHRELEDKRGIATSLTNLGSVACDQGDYATARSLYDESLFIEWQLGDKRGIAIVLGNLGYAAQNQRDSAAARSLYEKSLAIRRGLGDKSGIAMMLGHIGDLAYIERDYEASRSMLEENLAIRRDLGDKSSIAVVLADLGTCACIQRDYASARSLYEESLAIRRELGGTLGIITFLATVAQGEVKALEVEQPQTRIQSQTRVQQAVKLLGAVEALLEVTNSVLTAREHNVYEQIIKSAHAQLGEDEFDKAWAEGRALGMDEALELAFHTTPWLSAQAACKPTATSEPLPDGAYSNGLTNREVDVLRLLATGLTNKEIAAQLSLSVHTVESHLHSAYGKLGVTTRGAASKFAIEHGLV